jgi:hypothetical protein
LEPIRQNGRAFHWDQIADIEHTTTFLIKPKLATRFTAVKGTEPVVINAVVYDPRIDAFSGKGLAQRFAPAEDGAAGS